MRKILLSMLGVIVALTSCQKDDLSSEGNGREVAISVAASLPKTMTKAIAATGASDKSGIENVDWSKVSLRYTLEVYDNGTLVPVQTGGDNQRILYKDAKDGADNVVFNNVRLLSGKDYQFVIWADFVTRIGAEGSYTYTDLHYVTTHGLKAITQTTATRIGSDDSRDAYFATQTVNVTAPTSEAITLKRPFGKLRVITTDIKDIHKSLANADVTVTYNTQVPTGFNAFDGTVSATTAIPANYTAKIEELTTTQATLAFDYIFADATTAESPVQTPIDFKVSCLGAEYDFASSSVKIERNKLTTVKGNLLTKGVNVSVSITDAFDGDPLTNDIADVLPTVTAVQEKLNNAASEVGEPVIVKVTGAVSSDQQLTIPVDLKLENTPKIELDFSAGITSGQTLTIAEEKPSEVSTHYVGEVHISVPESNTAGLVVNMPSATVYINGKLSTLDATVSPNTLVIAKDAEIGTLTINAGNVDIYGTVTTVTESDNYDGVVRVFVGEGTDRTETTLASIKTAVAIAPYVVLQGAWPTLQMKDIAQDLTLEGVDGATIQAIDATNGDNYGGKIDNTFVFKNLKFVGTHTFPSGSDIGTRALGFNCAAITIDGCNFTNVSVASGQNAATTAIIKNNYFEMSSGAALYLPAWIPTAGTYTISGNTFKNCRINTDCITGRTTIKNNTFTGTSNDSYACNVLVNPFRILTAEDITAMNTLFTANTGLTATYLYFNEGHGISTLLTGQIALAAEKAFSVNATYPAEGSVIIDHKIYALGTNAFHTIPEAFTVATSGATVHLSAGTYDYPSTAALTIPAGVTLEGVGAETVINGQVKPLSNSTLKNLKLFQPKLTWGSNQGLAYAPVYMVSSTVSGVTIDNVDFDTDNKGTTSSSGATAIYVSVNSIIKNCSFTNYWKSIFVGSTSTTLTIADNEFNYTNPISCVISQADITGNTFRRNKSMIFDVQFNDMSGASEADLAISNGNVTASESFKTAINAFRANNTWEGNDATDKPLRIRAAGGTKVINADLQ